MPETDAASAEDVLVVTQELSSDLDYGDDAVLRVRIAADRLIDGYVQVATAFGGGGHKNAAGCTAAGV